MKKTIYILALSCATLNLNIASASNKPNNDPTKCEENVRARVIQETHSSVSPLKETAKLTALSVAVQVVGRMAWSGGKKITSKTLEIFGKENTGTALIVYTGEQAVNNESGALVALGNTPLLRDQSPQKFSVATPSVSSSSLMTQIARKGTPPHARVNLALRPSNSGLTNFVGRPLGAREKLYLSWFSHK